MNLPPVPARPASFRRRLTAAIALTIIAVGAVVLVVQYLAVRQLLGDIPAHANYCPGEGVSNADCGSTLTAVPIGTRLLFWTLGPQASLADNVFAHLLLVTILVFVALVMFALLAADHLARRSLARVSAITETTRRITRDGLGRRLRIGGPRDEFADLGDTIDEMLERLEASFDRQSRFVANASHELRSPLAATRTALEIPLEQGRVPADLEPAIRRALAANARGAALLETLLAFARAEERATDAAADGAPAADLAPSIGDAVDAVAATDLVAVVEAARDDLAGELEARRMRIAVDAPAAGASAAADPSLLAIAVRNLLENAARHGTHGTEIGVRFASGPDRVELEIENEGRALTNDAVERLREPFHRGAASRTRAAGSGLGLAIVDSIARAEGGALRLRPRDGGGLVATLELPAVGSARAG